MTILGFNRFIWHPTRWLLRQFGVLMLVAAGLLALAALFVRFWFVPHIENYQDWIARSVSQSMGQLVTVEHISAGWEGLNPLLKLDEVVLHDKAGRAALRLHRVDTTVSWLSLAQLRLRLDSLDFYNPRLDIRRDRSGMLSVGGIELNKDSQGGGFLDWVFDQNDIEIHNATVNWTDELKGAPTLRFEQFALHLNNEGKHHRFALYALPPSRLSSALHLSGDWVGRSAQSFSQWSGQLTGQLAYVNLEALGDWVNFPLNVTKGEGSLRMKVDFTPQGLSKVLADLTLSRLHVNKSEQWPALDLAQLSGHVNWKKTSQGFELSTQNLVFDVTGHQRINPMNVMFKTHRNEKGEVGLTQLDVNELDLRSMFSLLGEVALSPALREQWLSLSPQGSVFNASLQWSGSWPEIKKYSAKAVLKDFSILASEKSPGVTGLSGLINLNDKSGNAQIEGKNLHLHWPSVFQENLAFDFFRSNVNWQRQGAGFLWHFSQIDVKNKDISGQVSADYESSVGQPGRIDMQGHFDKLSAASLMRYLPMALGRTARPWLEAAFLGGESNDTHFKVQGNLKDFPFANERQGVFQVVSKIQGGVLHYANAWPNLENINGTLTFMGKRMNMMATSANFVGLKLSQISADIADLTIPRGKVVSLSAQAEGASSEFLRFVDSSPVSGYINHFTSDMNAEGAGKLSLKLELPLADLAHSRFTGLFQVSNNKWGIDQGLPPLEKLNARLEFNENGATLTNANAVFYDSPLSFSGNTQKDGLLNVALRGRFDSELVRRLGGPEWLEALQGSAEWRGRLSVKKKEVDIVLESNLLGITSSLPAPLSKLPNERANLRIERQVLGNGRDTVRLTYADLIDARLNRSGDFKSTQIDRGVVSFGGAAPSAPSGAPAKEGLWLMGRLKSVNLDGWMKYLSTNSSGSSGGKVKEPFVLAGVDVLIGQAQWLDRKLSNLSIVSALNDPTHFQMTLHNPDIDGSVDWLPKGKGLLFAKFKKFTLYDSLNTQSLSKSKTKSLIEEQSSLPALDITVDQFILGTKLMGKLELKASYQGRDWSIDQLKISNEDSTLNATGQWQSWMANPKTKLKLSLKVNDIGKMLDRFGYTGSISRGEATLEGGVNWNGAPQQLDYSTLSGEFNLQASKGQFLKMRPGIGKLLGILSLQSLPRRLSLDFRDIFSEGLSFDVIQASVKMDKGVLHTDDFKLNSTAARVAINGSADLKEETQNLHVKVNPHLSDGASVVGALAVGPIAGIGMVLGQKFLKDPLDELLAYRYDVTGSWNEPIVTKATAPRPSESAPIAP